MPDKKQRGDAADFAALLSTVRPNTVREMSDEMRSLVQKIQATGGVETDPEKGIIGYAGIDAPVFLGKP